MRRLDRAAAGARRAGRLRRAALAALAALAVAGCGSPGLWARWRAERDQWRAQRELERLRIEPRLVSPADRARVTAAWRLVVARWPAAEWVPRAAHDSLAADVARIAGRAAIQLARLEASGRGPARAVATLERTGRAFAPVWPIALEAALAQVAVLDRAGDSTAARRVDEAIARQHPVVAPDGREVLGPVLDAARRVAGRHERDGRRAAADSARRATAAALTVALARPIDGAVAARLWVALGEVRAAAGDPAGRAAAAAALRQALGEPALGALAGDVVLRLGELALAGGQPDSAIAYARWAGRGFDPRHAPPAVALEARAWEARGRPDSALAAWGRFVDSSGDGRAVIRARWERARLFEQLDGWEQARGELHAVVAGDPLGAEAFAAFRRLVDHHLERNEPELARFEARWALERIDRTLATVLDPGVLLTARRTRAELLLAIGEPARACAALVELWRSHAGTADGVRAGFQAAELAERRLGDRAQAARLYRELAGRVSDPALRREAQARADRLTGRG